MIALLHGRGPKPEREHLHTLWFEALSWRFAEDFPELLESFQNQEKRTLYYGDLSNEFLVDEVLGPLSARQDILTALKTADFNTYLGPLPYNLEHPPADITSYWDKSSDFGIQLRQQIDREIGTILESNEPTILIAHSLGAVLAIESLFRLDRRDAQLTLVTIGSPLTHSEFLKRLEGFPKLRKWVDLRAQGDLICGPSWNLSHPELGVEEHALINPANKAGTPDPHHALGYLSSPTLSKVLASWLSN